MYLIYTDIIHTHIDISSFPLLDPSKTLTTSASPLTLSGGELFFTSETPETADPRVSDIQNLHPLSENLATMAREQAWCVCPRCMRRNPSEGGSYVSERTKRRHQTTEFSYSSLSARRIHGWCEGCDSHATPTPLYSARAFRRHEQEKRDLQNQESHTGEEDLPIQNQIRLVLEA